MNEEEDLEMSTSESETSVLALPPIESSAPICEVLSLYLSSCLDTACATTAP